ncbi:MAG: glycosyltransferase family 2 protein [Clostridia bacterium]|nr:glycosyltransferase family 2 protein [Clostridia bacterium]MBR4050190.1 glycosyltransferase family 2 protein [Clostridia bacterium]
MDKKKISVMIPCYNEEENARPIYEAVKNELVTNLPQYDYEILFIDNKSTDSTRKIIREICKENKKVRAIFNCRNFGQFNSPYYGIINTSGDCCITICADFQDPVELIPQFVKEWENGYKVVIGVKTQSKESKIMYALRSLYYKAIKKMSNVEQIEHFTGFGLYDKSFVKTLRELDDPQPFIRGIVAELGPERKEIEYTQPKRRAGKTHNNFYSLYDAAMLSFTSYTKIGLRLAVFAGGAFSLIGFIIALIYLILKLVNWYRFPAGTTPILIGVFLMGSIQMFFIGLLGEYIMNINSRVMKRPLVVEEERLNFEEENENGNP